MVDFTSVATGLNNLYSQNQSTQAANATNNQVNTALGNQQNLLNNQAGQINSQIAGLDQNFGNLYNNQQDLLNGYIGGLQQNQQNSPLSQFGEVSGMLGDQRNNLSNLYGQMQGQVGANSQYAQDLFNKGTDLIGQQREGLQGDIDRQTQAMGWLTDADSPVMQMARQAIERQDAAAGRRSQWGEREVQLAALMAENYGKYAPGLQQGIQNSRNAMSNDLGLANNMYQNIMLGTGQQNQNLMNLMLGASGQMTKDLGTGADIYNMLDQSDSRNTALLGQAIGGTDRLNSILSNHGQLTNQAINSMGNVATGMGNLANSQNTTGRQAGNSANNQQNQLINSLIGQGGSLLNSLLGGGNSGGGITDFFGMNDPTFSSSLINDWLGGGATGGGGLGNGLDALFGNNSISGDGGIGFDYGGTSGGITDFMNNAANSGGDSLWDSILNWD